MVDDGCNLSHFMEELVVINDVCFKCEVRAIRLNDGKMSGRKKTTTRERVVVFIELKFS